MSPELKSKLRVIPCKYCGYGASTPCRRYAAGVAAKVNTSECFVPSDGWGDYDRISAEMKETIVQDTLVGEWN